MVNDVKAEVDQKFTEKRARLLELRKERAGHEDALQKAQAAVQVAKGVADEARIAAVVDPATAPAAAQAETAIRAALETRDRLAARGGDLGAAIKKLEADLSAMASAARASGLEKAKAQACAELLAVKEVAEEICRDAFTAWGLNGDGPITSNEVGKALAKYAGLNLDQLRNEGLNEVDRIRTVVSAPAALLAADLDAANAPPAPAADTTAAYAQHLARPTFAETKEG